MNCLRCFGSSGSAAPALPKPSVAHLERMRAQNKFQPGAAATALPAAVLQSEANHNVPPGCVRRLFKKLDKDGSGDVDASEVIAVFYRRYGKAGAMKKLDMLVDQQALDKTITFTDFLEADNKLRLDARRVMSKNRQRSVEPPTRSVVVTRPI